MVPARHGWSLRTDDGPSARQVCVSADERVADSERLDNEILAGLRLARVAASAVYPPEGSRLYGYDPASAEPFALLGPYRGETLPDVGPPLLPEDRHQFPVTQLRAICCLSAWGPSPPVRRPPATRV